MAEGNIQVQRGRRTGRRTGGGTTPRTLLPLRRVSSHLSNSISCWYCDFKSSVFNEPLFQFGRKYFRWLRIWFSIGMGFSLTTLIGVTLIILLESARALNLYNGIPWLNNILNGSIFGSYSSLYNITVADIGYMCISSIISVSIHELGHALSATSEGIQIEYTAVFLAVLFPGALVAFNDDLLQMIPRVATLRIYCAGIWHNAALCLVCALTLFLLPFIVYPLYSHGESLMVLDVSRKSPLYGHLSPGDIITMLDGAHVHTTKEWMDISYFLEKQKSQTNKGYCVPNLEIAGSKNPEIMDNKFICPNDLTLFTTISCNSRTNETDHQQTKEHIYCFPAKGVLGEKKCGDGWGNLVKDDGNCLCTDDESCSSPIHMTGVTWVEITFSRHECENKENKCGGSFVFVGDIISMARSIRVTNYQSRWFYGVVCVPVVVEKLLVNIFHVSLMLALLNSLPVYYLDGESILEVALCCFSSLTPRIRELVVRSCLVGGTLICCLLISRILFLVISY
ncbi:membrane-bound transcription factor site-2 protease homolog [Lactuca sativa]|uniref:Endopeptidase S2P n=1 Tax=Lactuca sativa TaxID=4236 RepID=A0A9R1WEH4_LACSA|nr:membrane-bound transcription factor site-2 protease homolog [Lactuca sativa]KAJ0223831.1 hypothetical protein LSAT_V11C200071860 [Lactuca sativa]